MIKNDGAMNREDKIISVAIVSIWVFMLLFAILTLIQPSWLEQAASAGVKVEAATKKRAGDLYLGKKEYVNAIALYNQALQLDSTMKGAEANKAMAFFSMGNYQEAIKVYRELLKQQPDYPDLVYYNLAEIYSKTGNKKEALECYINASKTAAYPAKDYRRAGKLLMDEKKWEAAAEQFQLALDNSPTPQNLYRSMLKKSLTEFKDSPDTKQVIQQSLDRYNYNNWMADYDTTLLNSLLNQDFEMAKTYNYLGYCYAMTGNYDDAAQYFKHALKIEPNYTDAIDNLGAVEILIKQNS